MDSPRLVSVLLGIIFFFIIQAGTLLGCYYTYQPFRKKKFWLILLIYLFCLNISYPFLFFKPFMHPVLQDCVHYLLIYPYFTYMLICFILFPLYILSGIFVSIKKAWQCFLHIFITTPEPDGRSTAVFQNNRRVFLKTMTSGIILPLTSCSLYGAYVGRDKLTVEKKTLYSTDFPGSLNGFTIVQISDIHAGPFMDERRLRPIVQIVNGLKPDLVVITGDIINWGTVYLKETAQVLSEIKARLGVYAIMGNHDFYCDIKIFSEMLQKASIKLLRNSWEIIGRSETTSAIYLIGIDDPRGSWYFNKRLPALEEIIAGIPVAGFKILLSHRPTIFDDAETMGIHLTLAGHTHGGQIILPFRGVRSPSLARLVYPNDYGLYQKAKSYLYVNKGLGVVGPPIRINCPQEITCLDLREA